MISAAILPLSHVPPSLISSTKMSDKCQTNSHFKLNNKHVRNNSVPNPSKVSQILRSRSQVKLSTQENEINDLKKTIQDLIEENKTMRTQNFRQQKQIDNSQKEKVSIANIFKQHEADITNLKEKLRKSRTSLSNEKKIRNEVEIEIFNLKTALFKAQKIIDESKLLDMHDLQQQLINSKELMATKELEFETVKKHLDIQEKNYKVEMSNVQKQIRFYNEQYEELQAYVGLLKVSLKEKQNLLNIQNIYSNRFNLTKIKRKECCSHCLSIRDMTFTKSKLPITCKSVIDLPKLSSVECGAKPDLEFKNETTFNQLTNEKDISTGFNDLRKIIIQEIKQNKLNIFNNKIHCDFEIRTGSPIYVSPTDSYIFSPKIQLDAEYNKKNLRDIERNKGDDNLKNIIKDKIILNKNVNDKVRKTVKLDLSKNELNITNNAPKSKIKRQLPCSNLPNISEYSESKPSDIYLYPNNNAVVDNENWFKDIETIAVLDGIGDVPNKCHKKVANSNVNVMNNADKCNNLIKTVLKLPQPLIEDLKDKQSVINDKLKNNLLNNVIGNCDSKLKSNLKSSLQKFLFSKQANKVDITITEMGQ